MGDDTSQFQIGVRDSPCRFTNETSARGPECALGWWLRREGRERRKVSEAAESRSLRRVSAASHKAGCLVAKAEFRLRWRQRHRQRYDLELGSQRDEKGAS
jgi:hypothetical protein